jgi:hypothetical protein
MDLFGPEPVTIWDIARHWLGRPMLTKLLKEHGKAAVKAATLKTLEDEAVEQTPYLIAILQEGGTETVQLWQMPDRDLMTMAVEKGIATKGKTRQQLLNDLR